MTLEEQGYVKLFLWGINTLYKEICVSKLLLQPSVKTG